MNTAPDGRNETLDELFGSVYELAGEFAWRIGRDEVEIRLGRVLRQAGQPGRLGQPGQAQEPTVGQAQEPTVGQAQEPTAGQAQEPTAGQAQEPTAGASESRVTSLAADIDQDAWNEIVERYAPLVYATCQRYLLSNRDIEDVGRRVWGLLAEQIGRLREPAALPGWLATTAARECLRVRRPGPLAGRPEDRAQFADAAAVTAEILAAERDAALRVAMAELPPRYQQLLAMLMHDPPYSYQEISAKLGIPVGSIGPQRTRCLDRLRRSIALAAVRDDPPSGTIARGPLPEQ